MRFCTNCGERMSDEQAFCPNCGTPIKQAAPKPAVTFEPEISKAKPKKSRAWLIALIAVVCVLAVAVILLGYFLLGWFRAPHVRLQTYLDNGSKLASVAILEKGDAEDFSADGVLSLDARDVLLPEEAESLAYYYFGMDSQTLLNGLALDLNIDTDHDKREAILQTALRISGGQLMGYTFTADEDGFGAYASACDQYAVVDWDMLGVSVNNTSRVSAETLSDLVLALSDACKLLLTEESVELERGYRLKCVDGEEVKCARYIACPGENEWVLFFESVADIMEDNEAVASALAATLSNGDVMTVSELADKTRDEAESLASHLADCDLTFELYLDRSLPIGAAISFRDSDKSFEFMSSSHGTASSGVRGMTLDVESGSNTLAAVELCNEYFTENNSTRGEVSGTVEVPGSDFTIDLDGQYEGKSFDLTADLRVDGYEYPITMINDCKWKDSSYKGTLEVGVSAPSEDGKLTISIDYDFDKEHKSVLHIPYGTYALSLDIKNLTYTYDEMLSNMNLSVTVEEGRNGGTDHVLTIGNLLLDDQISIRDASLIFSTTDERSTAEKPSVEPVYGDLYQLQEVLRSGVSLDLH